ncbi:MAG: AMP-binding protein [Succinivibrionaceae bacterium]|nr:AMP-binding protein [Succinivibrionaceae bacterium]
MNSNNETSRLFPLKFILEHRISEIAAVPTTIVQMNRLGMLKKDSMPDLRYAGFCGEPLPSDAAEAFCKAAPNAIVDNLYGPTEATIACAFYRIDPQKLETDSLNGIVPAGRPYRSTRTMITNPQFEPVPEGETGELLLSGSQLACGYWNDAEKTAASFVRIPGTDGIWYRTGDLAKIRNGNICYVGRNDGMVKVSGFRVELSEVDITVKKTAETDMAVTVAARHENENRLICFIPDSCGMSDAEIINGCRQRIPAYMIPTRILRLAEFPQNFNGKIDRKELTRLAQSALLETH